MSGEVTYTRNTPYPACARPRGTSELGVPVRRWRYLRRVMRTKRKLKVLVCQLTELHPTRYTRDIRDRFELANTRKLGTSPVVDFPGSYAVKPYSTDDQLYAH